MFSQTAKEKCNGPLDSRISEQELSGDLQPFECCFQAFGTKSHL